MVYVADNDLVPGQLLVVLSGDSESKQARLYTLQERDAEEVIDKARARTTDRQVERLRSDLAKRDVRHTEYLLERQTRRWVAVRNVAASVLVAGATLESGLLEPTPRAAAYIATLAGVAGIGQYVLILSVEFSTRALVRRVRVGFGGGSISRGFSLGGGLVPLVAAVLAGIAEFPFATVVINVGTSSAVVRAGSMTILALIVFLLIQLIVAGLAGWQVECTRRQLMLVAG
ncbi:MAG: hypothetical protein ACYDH5_04300 [Acidimicrobiales bacterium]